MVEASCHCGAIRLTIDSPPTEVTDCNCSLCRRYGVLWAYYSPRQVRRADQDGVTQTYAWNAKAIAFHRCVVCGCVTHWAALDPTRDRMGVNARLMDPEVLAQARVRHLDGAGTWTYRDP